MVRDMLKAACGAALTLFCISAPAAAQQADIYLAAQTDDQGKPFLTFVYSDSSAGGFAPVDATGVWVAAPFTPGGERFNPAKHCGWNHDFPTEIPARFASAPIYGPNAAQRSVSAIDLPSYMAREAARVLLEEGLVASEADAAQYFNCAGFVWADLTSQPPEVWREIIEQQKREQGIQ